MNTEFGTTAWGRDWQRLAEPTSITRPDPTLPRARSLARRDYVRDVQVAPGRATADVDRNGCHRVTVEVPVWDEDQLDHARSVLSGLSDDLPDSIHSTFVRHGQSPGPEPATVTATCTCRGRARPCAHVLATYFELARQLDNRPRLALTLRGLTDSLSSPTTARVPIGLIDPTHFYGSSG